MERCEDPIQRVPKFSSAARFFLRLAHFVYEIIRPSTTISVSLGQLDIFVIFRFYLILSVCKIFKKKNHNINGISCLRIMLFKVSTCVKEHRLHFYDVQVCTSSIEFKSVNKKKTFLSLLVKKTKTCI